MWGCVTGAEIRVGVCAVQREQYRGRRRSSSLKMMGYGRKARRVGWTSPEIRCCITTFFVTIYMGIRKYLPRKPWEDVLLFASRVVL